MKRFMLLCLIASFITTSTHVLGAQTASLGLSNLAIKLDYIWFTEGQLENIDVDTGWYVGVEGFYEVNPNLYLGMEVGYANPDGGVDVRGVDVDTELTFVPVEVNLKYLSEVAPQCIVGFGGGFSYNYIEKEVSIRGLSADDDDWLFGGQVFIDLNYTVEQVFFGINGKYQLTEDVENGNYDYSNWRIGGQVGLMF